MISRATRMALILATLVSGLLAGFNLDRALVAMPAWNAVGAVAWAEFSRRADLGAGLILYPFEAIGGALLTLAAAIGVHFTPGAPRLAARALDAAVLLAAGGLALTAMAAPIMLGIGDVNDPAALRRAFEGFWYWGDWRALCQILAFFAQLAALAMLLRGDKARP